MSKNATTDLFYQVAQSLGMRFDAEGGAMYGTFGGFHVLVSPTVANNPYILAVDLSAHRSTGPLTKEDCKQFKREHPQVKSLTQNGTTIVMTLKKLHGLDGMQEGLRENISTLVRYLQSQGFTECCQSCGAPSADPCYISGSYAMLCRDCFTRLQKDRTALDTQKKGKHDNVVGGIVGALLGSLIGVAAIIIFSRLGYIAAVSGVILAVCTLKGYELLGGKLNTKGIIITAVMMLVMTWLGDRLDWAIVVAQELETDFISAFQLIPDLLEYDIIDSGDYFLNLFVLYLFTVLGAVPTILSTIKNRRLQGVFYRLSPTEQSVQGPEF